MLLKKQLFPMFRRSRGAVKCEKSTLEKGVSNRESTVGRLNERTRGAESGVKAAGLTGVDTGLENPPQPKFETVTRDQMHRTNWQDQQLARKKGYTVSAAIGGDTLATTASGKSSHLNQDWSLRTHAV